jgi:hypothetical protein
MPTSQQLCQTDTTTALSYRTPQQLCHTGHHNSSVILSEQCAFRADFGEARCESKDPLLFPLSRAQKIPDSMHCDTHFQLFLLITDY